MRIAKGRQVRLAVTLVPVDRLSVLVIQNATPGSEVLVDQKEVGVILSDGTFRLPTITAGDRVIELRKKISSRFVCRNNLWPMCQQL